MATEKIEKNVWYIPHPTHQYNEDVKALAKKHSLIIVDANVVSDEQRELDEAPNVPKLTLTTEAAAEAAGEPLSREQKAALKAAEKLKK